MEATLENEKAEERVDLQEMFFDEKRVIKSLKAGDKYNDEEIQVLISAFNKVNEAKNMISAKFPFGPNEKDNRVRMDFSVLLDTNEKPDNDGHSDDCDCGSKSSVAHLGFRFMTKGDLAHVMSEMGKSLNPMDSILSMLRKFKEAL